MSPYRILLILFSVFVCLILHKTYAVTDADIPSSSKRRKLNRENDTSAAVRPEYEKCIKNLLDNICDKSNIIESAKNALWFLKQPKVEVPEHSDYWLEYYKLFYKSILPVKVQPPTQYCYSLRSYYYEKILLMDLERYIGRLLKKLIPDEKWSEFNNISEQKVKQDIEKYTISLLRGKSKIPVENGSTFNDILTPEEITKTGIFAAKVLKNLVKEVKQYNIMDAMEYQYALADTVVNGIKNKVKEKQPIAHNIKETVRKIMHKISDEKKINDKLYTEFKKCKKFLVKDLKFPNEPPVEIIRHAFYALVERDYLTSSYGYGFINHIQDSFQIYHVLQNDSRGLTDKHYEGILEPENYGPHVMPKFVRKGEEFPKYYAPEGTPLMLTFEQFCEERIKPRLIKGV